MPTHHRFNTLVAVLSLLVVTALFFLSGDSIFRGSSIVVSNVQLFYSQDTVVGYTAQGNPLVTTSISRIDGIRGSAVKIKDSSAAHGLNSSLQYHPATITTITDSFSSEKNSLPSVGLVTVIDADGHVLSTKTTDQPEGDEFTGPKTTLSPTQQYALTTSLFCTEEVAEGPCPMAFKARITDFQKEVSTEIQPRTFGLATGNALRADVAGFLTPTSAVILINDAQELYRQVIALLDVTTGDVTVLWTNIIDSTGTTGQTYTFHRFLLERQAMIAVERNTLGNSGGDRFVRVDFSPFSVTPISKPLNGFEQILSKDQRGYYYEPGFNQGVWYHNISFNTDRQVTPSGEVQGFSEDAPYLAIIQYNSNDIYGPQQLLLYDRRNNLVRSVYSQTSRGPSEATPKIGDRYYHFVALQD